MRRMVVSASFILLLAAGKGTYADDSVSKQIQMLNSQIQAQLQQIQEAQKKTDKVFNDQIQAQLKQIQTDIQKQINEGYKKTQDQIKAVQDAMQKQIQQVNTNVVNAAKKNTVNK